jgi:cell division septation protein DedD
VTACAGNRPPPPAAASPPPPPAPAIVTEETPAADAPAEPPTRPEQTENGRWRVSVISVRKAEETEAMVKRLEADGFKVATESAEAGGSSWHRVILPGLRRFADAKQMVAYVQHTYSDASQAWILPREGAAPAAPAAAAEAPAASAPAEQPAK